MNSPSNRETLTGLDKAEFLVTAILTQMAVVSRRLGEIFGLLPPRGDGEVRRETDWDELQTQNAEILEQGIAEAKEASRAHRVAKIAVSDIAARRRDAAGNLRARHRSHQKIVEGSCGKRGLVLTGLDAPPVKKMLGTREQSTLIVDRYEDPALPGKLAAIPKEEVNGPLPDTGALSSEMKEDVATFEAAHNGWTQATKVRDEAYASTREARRRLRRLVANVARVQEGYYRLAGFDDLADRLRLTVRSPRRKKPPADEPPTDEPGPPSPPADGPDASLARPANEA